MTGIWLTFSLFTFTFGWPEIAESISFLGNNIKLREVKNAINELKQLSAIFSSALLEFIQTSDRWGGFPEEKRQETYNSIDKMLKSFGFTSQEVEEIQTPWHYWVERDYIHGILVMNSIAKHPTVAEENTDEWNIRKKQVAQQNPLAKPRELRILFREFEAYSDVVKQLIDDFEYYKKNKQHRDPEKWKERHQWFKDKTL